MYFCTSSFLYMVGEGEEYTNIKQKFTTLSSLYLLIMQSKKWIFSDPNTLEVIID